MRDVFCKACEVRPLRRDQNYWDRNDILFCGFQRVTKDRMANDNFLFLNGEFSWESYKGKDRMTNYFLQAAKVVNYFWKI